jgi:F-type H+-transporting ATPase subunit a
VLAIMLAVSNSFHRAGRPGWLTRVFRGWCRWVRDEMVYNVMGKEEGRAWTPFFLFLFFFVAGQNLIGMIPGVTGVVEPATATGTPYVTGTMAVVTLLLMLGFGMKQNGVFGFFKGLLPHGLPVALIPLMIVVELTGLIVKPFALTVRLFANMLAGHLVIASSIGLIFVFAKMFHGSMFSYVTAVPAIGMAVFIYIIESFVVLLQAYIFTYLSVIFLHQAMHQEH